MLQDTEAIALQAVALVLIGAVLLAVADTPAYPVAIGIEVVALFYVLTSAGGAQAIGGLQKLIGRLGG